MAHKVLALLGGLEKLFLARDLRVGPVAFVAPLLLLLVHLAHLLQAALADLFEVVLVEVVHLLHLGVKLGLDRLRHVQHVVLHHRLHLRLHHRARSVLACSSCCCVWHPSPCPPGRIQTHEVKVRLWRAIPR